MPIIKRLKEDLNLYIDKEKADYLPKFFQAFPGGYGEGDKFLGVSVPDQRKVARRYCKSMDLEDVLLLLQDPFHECRLVALLVLMEKFKTSKSDKAQGEMVNLYLENLDYVNNWDLVDVSAYKILGPYLVGRDRNVLYQLAASKHLWRQRVSIMTTFYFIRQNDFSDTLAIARILLNHEHQLIHKAVGWMLREVGKRDFEKELKFLKENYRHMPRTMLRYAIERFEPELRNEFLKGLI